MKVSHDFSPKLLLVTLVVVTSMCLSNPLTAFATGPVDAGGVPGGVSVADSDGSGEAWGRSGGRTITYTVSNPSQFTSMTWGAVGATPVQLAFDNGINAPGETLNLDNGLSSLAGGVAVWTGQATIPLSVGSDLTLDTRFTLTVVDGSNIPIPLASVSGGNAPGIDVLSPGGPFTATLLFEANHNGSNGLPSGWTPVLDLFDALPTLPGNPPGGGGPVLTSFTSGFFFDGETGGLSIDDHDSNMLVQTNMIKSDLDFLKTDAINRLVQLAEEHDDIHTWINTNNQSVINAINQVLASIPDIPDIPEFPSDIATSEDVDQVRNDLQDILLILFGLAPCPAEAGPLCDSATFISDLATKEDLSLVKNNIQTLLDKTNEIKIQAVEVSGGSSDDDDSDDESTVRRWLLTTTVDGELVDVDLDRVLALTVNRSTKVNDVTGLAVPVPLGLGLLDVSIPLPREKRNAQAFQIDVGFTDTNASGQGSVLISSHLTEDDD